MGRCKQGSLINSESFRIPCQRSFFGLCEFLWENSCLYCRPCHVSYYDRWHEFMAHVGGNGSPCWSQWDGDDRKNFAWGWNMGWAILAIPWITIRRYNDTIMRDPACNAVVSIPRPPCGPWIQMVCVDGFRGCHNIESNFCCRYPNFYWLCFQQTCTKLHWEKATLAALPDEYTIWWHKTS